MEKLEIVVGMIDSVRLINKIVTNVLIFVKIICKIFKWESMYSTKTLNSTMGKIEKCNVKLWVLNEEQMVGV